MNGRRAKLLRKQAKSYVINIEKKPLGTGYNQYDFVDNRLDWSPQLDKDGFPMVDADGVTLMKPTRVRGTIFTAYLFRKIYQRLKKAYYAN